MTANEATHNLKLNFPLNEFSRTNCVSKSFLERHVKKHGLTLEQLFSGINKEQLAAIGEIDVSILDVAISQHTDLSGWVEFVLAVAGEASTAHPK